MPEQMVDARPRPRRRPGTGWMAAARRPAHLRSAAPAADVVIDLRDAPSSSSTEPRDATPPPEIDPRFRQRRLDVQAARDRRRIRVLRVVTVLVLVVAAAYGVLRSPLLVVRKVRVNGAVQTRAAAIIAAAGLAHHPLMIDLRLGRAAGAVTRLPWIDRVRIRRSWPDTVLLDVTERVPVAVVGGMLVDASGRVLSVAPGFAPLLPVRPDIGTTAPAPPPPGATLPDAYRPGIAVVVALPAPLRADVDAVLVRPDGTVRLALADGASALLGDPSQLPEKFEAVLTLVDRVRLGHGTVDVSVPSAPVLTRLPATGTVSTRTGG